ncbi:unnamed protein product [Rhizoctonia solani]|uniref:Integrase zinc-binding domain-containing protein n=1 Tax=Rhizoctonia solani TaxID=456999 RepID=A0A8H2X057_9AGAM|nr:unnamed protein product [Rhizoctonia solani]
MRELMQRKHNSIGQSSDNGLYNHKFVQDSKERGTHIDCTVVGEPSLKRRESTTSIVSTTSTSSLTSNASSSSSSWSEIPWKRQREDNLDYEVLRRLPPALRSAGPQDKCHLVAEMNLSAKLEVLKYRFLTHEMSNQSLYNPSSTNNSPFIPSFEIVQDLATSSRHSCDHARPRSTGWKLEKNTFPAQGTSSNFVTAPVTYPASFQPGTPRNSSLLTATDGSECAYTPIVLDNESPIPQGVFSHSPRSKPHQSNSPKMFPFADAKVYRHSDPTPPTNGNDRSCGRHLLVEHSFTSSVLQNIVPENATLRIRRVHSKSSDSLDSTQSGTIEDTHFGAVSHNLPSRPEFTKAVDRYLSALSSKKISKALITQQLYEDIIFNLKCEKNNRPGIGTPQFRFWCRKHFVLIIIPRLRIRERVETPGSVTTLPIGHQDDGDSDDVEVVAHDGQPVVTRETIYDILIKCHSLANHAGRDKTTALVKQNYSWVPKVLIGEFIKLCPICRSKKISGTA